MRRTKLQVKMGTLKTVTGKEEKKIPGVEEEKRRMQLWGGKKC